MTRPEKSIVPSEQYECERFAAWLTTNGYRFTHIPNGMYTSSVKVVMANKRMGVSAGVPDYMILLKRGKLLFVEMKRLHGGAVSVEQTQWIEALRFAGHAAAVCCGFEVAKLCVTEWERANG